ncbi:MAG: hypothetical protein JWQ07_3159 [Ramlibacter sp.]|nr:hypothetical protein [Ramlibacter sp.]
MEELFNHPAVQAAALPFAVALIAAALLRNTRQLGLAIAAAFLCAVALTMGFGFESMTSAWKLVLVGIAAAASGAVLQSMVAQPRWAHRAIIAAAAAVAVLWVLQRILMQRDATTAILAGAGAAAYCVALLAGGERVSRDPVCAAAVALVMGLGSAALALLGASAQLAQLGIALGAGAGAVLLVQMLAGPGGPAAWTLGLCAQVTAALVGLLAVATGSLPWYCLLPLPLLAWSARMARGDSRPVWQRAVLSVLFAMVPALLAVALAWFAGGDPAA